MNPTIKQQVRITYQCRDIGYGIEEGTCTGRFTGARDWTGKYTFITARRKRMYLFEDEILTCEPAEPNTLRFTVYFAVDTGGKPINIRQAHRAIKQNGLVWADALVQMMRPEGLTISPAVGRFGPFTLYCQHSKGVGQ